MQVAPAQRLLTRASAPGDSSSPPMPPDWNSVPSVVRRISTVEPPLSRSARETPTRRPPALAGPLSWLPTDQPTKRPPENQVVSPFGHFASLAPQSMFSACSAGGAPGTISSARIDSASGPPKAISLDAPEGTLKARSPSPSSASFAEVSALGPSGDLGVGDVGRPDGAGGALPDVAAGAGAGSASVSTEARPDEASGSMQATSVRAMSRTVRRRMRALCVGRVCRMDLGWRQASARTVPVLPVCRLARTLSPRGRRRAATTGPASGPWCSA
jgi:hypothetical protein